MFLHNNFYAAQCYEHYNSQSFYNEADYFQTHFGYSNYSLRTSKGITYKQYTIQSYEYKHIITKL